MVELHIRFSTVFIVRDDPGAHLGAHVARNCRCLACALTQEPVVACLVLAKIYTNTLALCSNEGSAESPTPHHKRDAHILQRKADNFSCSCFYIGGIRRSAQVRSSNGTHHL